MSTLRATLSRLKGISVLGITNIAVKPLWLGFLTVLCPRYLPVEGLGVMLAALALAILVQSFSDFGITEFTLREVSRVPDKATDFLSTFLPLRLALLSGCVLAALFISAALGYASIEVVLLASVFQMATSLLQYLRMYARALGYLYIESVSTIIEKGSVILLGSIVVVLTQDVFMTLLGMVIGTVIGLMHFIWALYKKKVFWRVTAFQSSLVRTSLAHMLPIGLLGVGLALIYRLDMVFVPALLGEFATAQYGQATRVIDAFNMFPSLMIWAFMFPRLARHSQKQLWDNFRIDFTRIVSFLVVIASGLALVVSLFAPIGMRLLVGSDAYAESASLLRIIVWTFPLTCIKDSLYAGLIILGAYRAAGAVLFTTSVALLTLLYFGLPLGGLVLAAWTRIVVEAVLFLCFGVLFFRMLKKMSTSSVNEDS